jgi:hypothetical protein
VSLPELPDTFLGWLPVLYRVTDEEVLGSAGLDAYVVSETPVLRLWEVTLTLWTVPLILQDGGQTLLNDVPHYLRYPSSDQQTL